METTPQPTENTDRERVALLNDLRDCLGKERECLLDLNVTDLWGVMEEKHAILVAIEELPPVESPSETAASSSLRPEIDRLKEEIRDRARENTEFIQGSLAVFDEIVSRIVGTAGEDRTYRPRGAKHADRRSRIYRRKV